MYNNNAYNTYKNNSVNFASKEQLLLIILDGAVKFSKIGRQAILDKDIKSAHENIIKTQNIFYELMVSLDLTQSGDWGLNVISIYKFIIDKLVEANLKKDIDIMDEIIPLIEEVRDMWNEVYKSAKSN
ncbi:MAG TPA: flagellar export chaperone FliS [Clostridium sp.]|nr:flagellar export chaperone FliS [Clostridium sp.]